MSIPQTILSTTADYAAAPVGTIARAWQINRDVSTVAWLKVDTDHWQGTGMAEHITDEDMAESASFIAHYPPRPQPQGDTMTTYSPHFVTDRLNHDAPTVDEDITWGDDTGSIKYNVARPAPHEVVGLAGCNHCGAQVGERCYTPSGRPTKAHSVRIERAWSLEINRAYLERTR